MTDDPNLRDAVALWESEFLKVVSQDYTNILIAYSARRSVEDEQDDELIPNFHILILAYFVAYLYISISLGDIFPSKMSRCLSGQNFSLDWLQFSL